MKRGMNKKGETSMLTIIVAIVLLVVLLIFLLFAFTDVGRTFINNIFNFGGGQVNVQTVVSGCQVSCSTQLIYDYCSKKRNVVFEEKGKGELFTCEQLARRIPSVGLSCDSIDCNIGVSGSKGLCNGDLNPLACENKNNLGRANCESLSVCKWIDDNNPNDNIGTCALKTGSNCASFNDNENLCVQLREFGCEWQRV